MEDRGPEQPGNPYVLDNQVCGSGQEPATRRHRYDESSLQREYDKQMKTDPSAFAVSQYELQKYVAWTWLPGQFNANCPEIADYRTVRLAVLDRFPDENGSIHSKIGLSLFKTTIDTSSRIVLAGQNNYTMFKDFSQRPYYRAGRHILNSENTAVFETALDMDKAVRMAANCEYPTEEEFEPPTILAGFTHSFTLVPDWCTPMQDAIVKALQPDSPHLKCLLSPGGIVRDVSVRDGLRTITLDHCGRALQIRIPVWCRPSERVELNSCVEENSPLADLPRGEYTREKLVSTFTVAGLDWLQRRVLDDSTEIIALQDRWYNKRTCQHEYQTKTWKCAPAKLIRSQLHKALRVFMDFRKLFGRLRYTIKNQTPQTLTDRIKIFVKAFPRRPMYEDCRFTDNSVWLANLLERPAYDNWGHHCMLRGTTM